MVSREEVAYMQQLRQNGLSLRQIADVIPVSYGTVRRYLNQPNVQWVRLTQGQIVYIQGLVMADGKTEFPKTRAEVLKVFKLA